MLEYKDGIISLKDRMCDFENGSPVKDETRWNLMKKLPDQVAHFGKVFVGYSDIEKTFNRVRDISGLVLHSYNDRFKLFCKENMLHCLEDYNQRGFIVSKI